MNDLEAIAKFISRDSPHYARLFVLKIFSSVERLQLFPRSGRIVPELKRPSIREIILGDYRIVYRAKGKRLEILTVHNGAKLFHPAKFN